MSKVLLLLPLVVVLFGCSGPGQARHTQCQEMKNNAYGDAWGAALSGGTGQFKADIEQANYEHCEQMFDLVEYQAQLQQQQAQAQAQAQDQERRRLIQEKLSSPEMQKKLRSDSLKDLVSCARGEKGEKLPPDVLGMVEGMCKGEIDRRVDSGGISRAKVDKIINQGS